MCKEYENHWDMNNGLTIVVEKMNEEILKLKTNLPIKARKEDPIIIKNTCQAVDNAFLAMIF